MSNDPTHTNQPPCDFASLSCAMSADTPPTAAPFRFLDLPKELRFMIYELLPVARIHRKINDFPTLVVLWSPTEMLRACREVMEEAKWIVNATAKRYRYARKTCPYGDALSLDRMPRMRVEWLEGLSQMKKIPQLIRAAFDCRDAVDNVKPTSIFILDLFGSSIDEKTASFITEWSWQAAQMLATSMHRAESDIFDIAVTFPNTTWHDVRELGESFTDSEVDQLASVIQDANLPETVMDLNVYFTLMPSISEDGGNIKARHDMLFARSCLKPRVQVLGCTVAIDEQQHMWDENEWL